jgi:Chitinase class I
MLTEHPPWFRLTSLAAQALIIGCAVAVSSAEARDPIFEPDRDWFFSHCSLHNYERTSEITAIRKQATVFTPEIKTSINGIFDVWSKYGDGDKQKLAYILATARRESSGTWQPVREAPKCRSDEACRERVIGDLLAKRAKAKNKPVSENYARPAPNGNRYYGRGYIQLTFENNYCRADRLLKSGTQLHANPDEALEQRVAQTILVRGMLEGWYGSRKPLSYWINSESVDWINARNNVNPKSPNKSITAESAKEIYKCLR